MITFMIVLFIAGYIMIALEHVVNINKATFALMMCGILWAAYAVCGNDPNLSEDMVTALGDTCEIVVLWWFQHHRTPHPRKKQTRAHVGACVRGILPVEHTRQYDHHYNHGNDAAPHAV